MLPAYDPRPDCVPNRPIRLNHSVSKSQSAARGGASLRTRLAVLGILGVVCGFVAAVASEPAAEKFYLQSSQVERGPDEPLLISAEKPVGFGVVDRRLGQIGDFDLNMTVELPERSVFDIAFRVQLAQVGEGDVDLFHARFGVLRLSTLGAGPPLLTREEALFGDRTVGLEVAPGHPASIQIEGRGHRVRANVAGQWTPWMETVDDRGPVQMVLRGPGAARVPYLLIRPFERPSADLRMWSGLAGLGLGLAFAVFGAGLIRGVVGLLSVPAWAAIGGTLVLGAMLPSARPTEAGVVVLTWAGLPLALVLSRMRASVPSLVALVLAVLASFAAQGYAAKTELQRLARFEDPRLTGTFGPFSWKATLDGLAGRISASHAVQLPTSATRRAVFGGGAAWFEEGGTASMEHNLGALLEAELTRRFDGQFDGVVIPTRVACPAQQVVFLESFVVDAFKPDAVVFTVAQSDIVDAYPQSPTAILDRSGTAPAQPAAEAPAEPGVLDLALRAWTGQLGSKDAVDVPAEPAALARILDRLAALAESASFEVVIYVPEPWTLTAGQEAARLIDAALATHGWHKFTRPAGKSDLEVSRAFADVLQPLWQD